ncbi:MAG: type II toxin-antitoxin system RelE/ParE family toxin [Chloroflexi bacterium]|nr:type II toxin-antitoxin system RelE/ParE family toxin [Chloroflexota bacterium]
MNVEYKNSFVRDIKRIRNNSLKTRVQEVLVQLEGADSLSEIANLKKLRGTNNSFRIRVGNYRLGGRILEDRIVLVRFLHRKDIYRYFP